MAVFGSIRTSSQDFHFQTKKKPELGAHIRTDKSFIFSSSYEKLRMNWTDKSCLIFYNDELSSAT